MRTRIFASPVVFATRTVFVPAPTTSKIELAAVPPIPTRVFESNTPPILLLDAVGVIKLLEVVVRELLMFPLLKVTPPMTLLVFAVEPVIVPASLRLVLERVTPPMTLLVLAVDPVIVPASVRLVLDRVTPPIELDAVDVPIKLLEVVVRELLMFPPLMSNVKGTIALRITDATTLLVTVSVVPLNVKFD